MLDVARDVTRLLPDIVVILGEIYRIDLANNAIVDRESMGNIPNEADILLYYI